MGDPFSGIPSSLDSPFTGLYAITPSDSVDINTTTRSIYVGGTGNVKITARDGTTDTLYNVPAGFVIPGRVSRVWATGTTATLMTGLY